ncbi:hypothetical protein A464_2388 [Salmonella bongori N268-08]|uniref:Uncharacterized protein n=1 Tax=Salmonella bongori N268-08 TaxID=1197719 RepID=S5MY10_SALBN|nr:hypothetical protein A464_2388 [Salmonella bongori N268-08]
MSVYPYFNRMLRIRFFFAKLTAQFFPHKTITVIHYPRSLPLLGILKAFLDS